MNKTQRDAIYDAVAAYTGLAGVWENQKSAPKLPEPSFSLRLLNVGTPMGRKGGYSHMVEGGRQDFTTRLNATLQIKVFGEHDGLSTINNSRLFHKLLNAGGVVSHGLLMASDASTLFSEWSRVCVYDIQISYTTTTVAQDDEQTDSYIEKITINGKRIPDWEDPEPEPEPEP